MRFIYIAIISIMSLLIAACGGGSGGDSSSSSTVERASETPVTIIDPVVVAIEEETIAIIEEPEIIVEVKPDPDAIYDKTSELIVAKSFLFEQEYDLSVSYNNDDNRSVYLSVCSDFTEGDDGVKVNYNSCLLRTSINGYYSNTLKVGNDKTRLVMAIWYLDDVKNPRYEVWKNDINTVGAKQFTIK